MEVNISILLSPNCDDLGINPLYHLSVFHLSDTCLGVSASNRLFPNPSLFLFFFFSVSSAVPVLLVTGYILIT